MSPNDKDDFRTILSFLAAKSNTPADTAELRKSDENHRKEKLANDVAEQELKKRQIEISIREKEITLTREVWLWVKWVVSIYLFVACSVVLCVAFCNKGLSNSVLIALLTTTTVNILVLPRIIVSSLFSNNKKSQE